MPIHFDIHGAPVKHSNLQQAPQEKNLLMKFSVKCGGQVMSPQQT